MGVTVIIEVGHLAIDEARSSLEDSEIPHTQSPCRHLGVEILG